MAYDDQNIFAKILRGELPAIKVYEDDQVLEQKLLTQRIQKVFLRIQVTVQF